MISIYNEGMKDAAMQNEKHAVSEFVMDRNLRPTAATHHSTLAVQHKCRVSVGDAEEAIRRELTLDDCRMLEQWDGTSEIVTWLDTTAMTIVRALCINHDIQMHRGMLSYDGHEEGKQDFDYVFFGKEYGQMYEYNAKKYTVDVGGIRVRIINKFYDRLSGKAKKKNLNSYEAIRETSDSDQAERSGVWGLLRKSCDAILKRTTFFDSWFSTVVYTATLDVLKKEGQNNPKHDERSELDNKADDESAYEPEIGNNIDNWKLRLDNMELNLALIAARLGDRGTAKLAEELKRLDSRDLFIVAEKLRGDKNSKEIGMHLGCEATCVDTRYSRFLSKLRKKLLVDRQSHTQS